MVPREDLWFCWQVQAQKPSWQAGSTAPVKLAQNIKTKGASVDQAAQKLPLDLASNGDDDLIDEDTLLTEEDRQRPATGMSCNKQCAFTMPCPKSMKHVASVIFIQLQCLV